MNQQHASETQAQQKAPVNSGGPSGSVNSGGSSSCVLNENLADESKSNPRGKRRITAEHSGEDGNQWSSPEKNGTATGSSAEPSATSDRRSSDGFQSFPTADGFTAHTRGQWFASLRWTDEDGVFRGTILFIDSEGTGQAEQWQSGNLFDMKSLLLARMQSQVLMLKLPSGGLPSDTEFNAFLEDYRVGGRFEMFCGFQWRRF